MVSFGRLPRSRASVALEIVPPTLMIAMGHPWLGATTLAGVLASATLQSWILLRAERQRDREILSFAQSTASMGGDPATVIAALRGHAAGEDADDVPAAGAREAGTSPPQWS